MPRAVNNFALSSGGAGYLDSMPTGRRFFVVDLPTSRPKSAVASRMSREPEFAQFLITIGQDASDHEAITRSICQICDIDSKAALDTDPDALARFEARIGMPYAAYRHRLNPTSFWKDKK